MSDIFTEESFKERGGNRVEEMQNNSSSLDRNDSRQKVLFMKESDSGGTRLLQTGALSLLLHAVLVFGLLGFGLRHSLKDAPAVYRVTILRAGDGLPQGGPAPNPSGSPEQMTPAPAPEKPAAKEEALPKVKPSKKDKKADKKEKTSTLLAKDDVSLAPKKGDKIKREKELRSLQEALEELHKTVAIDKLKRQMASESAAESARAEDSSKKAAAASSKSGGSGDGTGKGTGTGGVPGGPAIGSAELDSKRNQYYSIVEAKIKKDWTVPEVFSKGKTNLETVVVFVIGKDGKIQKLWIEKKSGNALFDQMAMRTLKKAEPLPPIPNDLGIDTEEFNTTFSSKETPY
jgi:TonB family protein